jgi:hypothetical protein
MLYTVLAILVAVLSYAFFQAAHHVDPNAQPHAPLHDTKWQRAATSLPIAESRTKPVIVPPRGQRDIRINWWF